MTNLVQFPGLGLELEVNRVAFSLGSLNVYWYGIMLASGLLLGLAFALHYAADFGIDSDRFIDVVVIGTIGAIVCARTFYVIFSPYKYDSLWEMINLRDGGIAVYGSILGAFVVGGLACRLRKIPLIPTFDLVAMGFLIGQGVGRWGNFFNQEAFGGNTTLPWGMKSENTVAYLAQWKGTLATEGMVVDPNLPVHPTFLYESIWCLLGVFLLWLYMKKRRFNGEIFLLYVVWYGAERFVVEGLRTDSLMIKGLGMRVSQVIALVSALLALVALVILYRRNRGKTLQVPLAVAEPKHCKLQQSRQGDISLQVKSTEGHADGPTTIFVKGEELPASARHPEFVAATKRLNDKVTAALSQLGQADPSEDTAPTPPSEDEADEVAAPLAQLDQESPAADAVPAPSSEDDADKPEDSE